MTNVSDKLNPENCSFAFVHWQNWTSAGVPSLNQENGFIFGRREKVSNSFLTAAAAGLVWPLRTVSEAPVRTDQIWTWDKTIKQLPRKIEGAHCAVPSTTSDIGMFMTTMMRIMIMTTIMLSMMVMTPMILMMTTEGAHRAIPSTTSYIGSIRTEGETTPVAANVKTLPSHLNMITYSDDRGKAISRNPSLNNAALLLYIYSVALPDKLLQHHSEDQPP